MGCLKKFGTVIMPIGQVTPQMLRISNGGLYGRIILVIGENVRGLRKSGKAPSSSN